MSDGISIFFFNNDFIKDKMYIHQRKHRQIKYEHRNIKQIAGVLSHSYCLDNSRVKTRKKHLVHPA